MNKTALFLITLICITPGSAAAAVWRATGYGISCSDCTSRPQYLGIAVFEATDAYWNAPHGHHYCGSCSVTSLIVDGVRHAYMWDLEIGSVTLEILPCEDLLDCCVAGLSVDCCGNGIVESGEACDDAGESATCDIDCTAAFCGDGVTNVTSGEACDDGGESAACDIDCTAAFCGDCVTNVTRGEVCDDCNTDDGDDCPGDCGPDCDRAPGERAWPEQLRGNDCCWSGSPSCGPGIRTPVWGRFGPAETLVAESGEKLELWCGEDYREYVPLPVEGLMATRCFTGYPALRSWATPSLSAGLSR